MKLRGNIRGLNYNFSGSQGFSGSGTIIAGTPNEILLKSSGTAPSEYDNWDNLTLNFKIFPKAGGGYHFFACVTSSERWLMLPTHYDIVVLKENQYKIGTYTAAGNPNQKFTGALEIMGSESSSIIFGKRGEEIKQIGGAIFYDFPENNQDTFKSNFAVLFCAYNKTSALTTPDGYKSTGFCTWQEFTNNGFLTEPYNININSSSKTATFTCDRDSYVNACEFSRGSGEKGYTDYPYNTYEAEERALFYEVACQNTESGLEGKFIQHNLKRWEKKTITIGVNFMQSVNTSNDRTDFKSYVKNCVDIINNTIGYNGDFYLSVIDGMTNGTYNDYLNGNGVGEIQLWWGNYRELFNADIPGINNTRYLGFWENNSTDENEKYITEGKIRLCTEKTIMNSFQGVAFEEIVEVLGIGNDVTHTADTTFSEFAYPLKNLDKNGSFLSINPKDLHVLEMMYNYDENTENGISSNVKPENIAAKINAPNGAVSNTTYNATTVELDLSCLTAGTYSLKFISATAYDLEGNYVNITSPYTREYSITATGHGDKPDYFTWDTVKESGINYNLTASEWNNFTAHINLVRAYMNLSEISFDTVFSGNELTAAIYNKAVSAIKDIDGYGAYLDEVNTGDKVTAKALNILVEELNAVLDGN